MCGKQSVFARAVVAAFVGTGLWASSAHAVLNYTGGTGGIVFGVGQYGAPVVNGGPTFIPNTDPNLPGVLVSPGHGFLTDNTSIVNNVAQFGPGPLPGFATWTGGFNPNNGGTFGSGTMSITGPAIGFALTDGNPDGGGVASYEIGGWTANYTNVGAIVGQTYGNSLAISGHLVDSSSAVAVALTTKITDTMNVFGAGGTVLPPLVLAAAGNPNGQAVGGVNGLSAGLFIAGNGNFVGLAINNLGPINIPNGDVITVASTLTAIGDPASLDVMYDLSDTQIPLDQLTNPNGDNGWGSLDTMDATPLLPSDDLVGGVPAPEPASLGLLCIGAAGLLLRRRRM